MSRTPDNSLPAQIELYAGATGTGKSHAILQKIAGESSLLVWDAKGEYHEANCHRITSAKVLAATLAANDHGRYAFAASDPKLFDFWCRAAFAWGNSLLIVEELPAVTHAGKATGSWGKILNQGRGFGLRVMCTAQRAAEIDKTSIGNCTLIHAREMVRAKDRAYLAAEMNLPANALDHIRGHDYLEYHVRQRRYAGKMPPK